MPRSKQLAIATERHSLRLIQQVPAGTPGAYGPDPIFGAYWSRSRSGLNGHGGFVSVENDPTLNDMSQMTVLLGPNGSDGRSHGDRFYCFADTIDPSNPSGPRASYFPGDEWLEVYRGQNEIVASGTPIDRHVDGGQGQVQLPCGDIYQILKKTRETAGGFWVNAPRDVIEHYSRTWLDVLAEGFLNSTSEFPASPSGTGSTPDGRWSYRNAYSSANGTVMVAGSPAGSYLQMASSWTDNAASHGCWRVEASLSVANLQVGAGSTIKLGVSLGSAVGDGNPVLQVAYGGAVQIAASGVGFPSTGAAVVNSALGFLLAVPLTLAIEARDRWYLYYLNGQLVGSAPRPAGGTGAPLKATLQVSGPGIGLGNSIGVTEFVIRRTSPPMNGGQPGDYFLPSAPAAGGLNGEYFDLTPLLSSGSSSYLLGSPTFGIGSSQPQTRLDASLAAFSGNPPTWQVPFVGAFGVRWTGAIYLPLASQDVVFQAPAGWATNADYIRVWVGRTRAGEQALDTFPVDPGFSDPFLPTSPGMRSWLGGSISGWYPIVIEYYWLPTNGAPPWTGNSNAAFTYNVGGAGTVPGGSVLSPMGIVHQQIRNDSHYDSLRSIAEQFVYQHRSTPAKLEDTAGPFGYIVPRARVGRDTDYILGEGEGINPTLDIKGDDVCSTLLADASGLGGAGTGALAVEAFNYQAMAQHPFVSSELESLPQHTFPAQLLMNLLSLLGYRSAGWEDLQSQSIGQRQMQDTFPLTGVLAEFDWQPGDGVRVQLPSLFTKDATPRQILSLKRMLYPDGMGDNVGSFRPRIRSPEETLRRFVRQVYGARRTFQGQVVNSEGTHVAAPNASEVILPVDLSTVRQATLVVLSKADTTTAYNVQVNGVTVFTITRAGSYDLGNYIAKNISAVNNAPEPRMLVALTGGPVGGVTYCVQLRVLVPTL